MNLQKEIGAELFLTRQEVLNKFFNEDDRFLVSKLFDKIDFVLKRNSIQYTDFLDMRQRQLIEKVLHDTKTTNYVAFGGFLNSERTIIVLYPEKLEELFNNKQFSFDSVMSVIRISLPNELKGIYSHRDYLGAIIKIGMKREKVGDIIVSKNGADIIVLKGVEEYILSGLQELTRFKKAQFELLKLENLNVEEPKTEKISIIIPSMRIDSIVSDIVKTSRAKALELIKEERVFVNHQLIEKGAKEVKQDDIITVRGKGRFKVGSVLSSTKKGNLVVEIEKYI